MDPCRTVVLQPVHARPISIDDLTGYEPTMEWDVLANEYLDELGINSFRDPWLWSED